MSYIAQIEVEIVAETTDGTPKLTAAGKLAVLIGDVVKHNATLRTKDAGVVGARVLSVQEKYDPEGDDS